MALQDVFSRESRLEMLLFSQTKVHIVLYCCEDTLNYVYKPSAGFVFYFR